MPLIIISGYPCCGKTKFSLKLYDILREKSNKKVMLVNEEYLNISKRVAYKDTFSEKGTRAAIKSFVNQHLNTNTFVIVDSLNYIKGFRYELFCIARSQRTQHCVVWIQSDSVSSELWNSSRNTEQRFDNLIFHDLKQRFEAPDQNNRWDNPIFRYFNIMDTTVPKLQEVVIEHPLPISLESPPLISESDVDNINSSLLPPDAILPGTDTYPIASLPSPPLPPLPPQVIPVKKSSWIRKGVALDVKSSEVVVGNNIESKGPYFSGVTDDNNHLRDNKNVELTCNQNNYNNNNTPTSTISSDEMAVIEEIFLYLTTSSAPVPNSSTVPIPHANADLLYQLNQISQTIIRTIIDHQKDCRLSDGSYTTLLLAEYDRSIELHRSLTLNELQRHQRLFVKMNSQHPPQGALAVGSAFIDFLVNQL